MQALARALFARCDILLLDDTFSGLDGETEQTVFDNLFGSTGLIRRLKTTVVLISNSCKFSSPILHSTTDLLVNSSILPSCRSYCGPRGQPNRTSRRLAEY